MDRYINRFIFLDGDISVTEKKDLFYSDVEQALNYNNREILLWLKNTAIFLWVFFLQYMLSLNEMCKEVNLWYV